MAKPFPIRRPKPLEMPRAGVPLVARLLTGIVGALCLVWALWAGREAVACALIAAFSFLGALEFFQAAGLGRRVGLGILVGLLVLTSATFEAETFLVAYGLSLTCLWLFYPLRREDPSRLLVRLSLETTGFVYVSLPFIALGMLLRTDGGLGWLVYLLFVVWMADVGGFVFGRLFGRHRVFAMSPSKTLEGFLGGVCSSALASWLAAWAGLVEGGVPWAVWPFLGAALGVLGALGDLFESFLKRALGIKDFGRSLPGHGGVLDRVDSLVFSSWALLLLRRIGL